MYTCHFPREHVATYMSLKVARFEGVGKASALKLERPTSRKCHVGANGWQVWQQESDPEG